MGALQTLAGPFPPRVLGGGIVLEKTAEPWEPIQAGFDGRSNAINSSGNEYAHQHEKLLVFMVSDSSQLSRAGRISLTISKMIFFFLRGKLMDSWRGKNCL